MAVQTEREGKVSAVPAVKAKTEHIAIGLKDLRLNKANSPLIHNLTVDIIEYVKEGRKLAEQTLLLEIRFIHSIVAFYENIKATENVTISGGADPVSKEKRARLKVICEDILGITFTHFTACYTLGKAISGFGWSKVEKGKLVISIPDNYAEQLSDTPDSLFSHSKTPKLKQSILDKRKEVQAGLIPATYESEYKVDRIVDELKLNSKTNQTEKTGRKLVIFKDVKTGAEMERSADAKTAREKYIPGAVFKQVFESYTDPKTGETKTAAHPLKNVSDEHNGLTDRLSLVSADLRIYREQLTSNPGRINQPLSRAQFEGMLSEIKLILEQIDKVNGKAISKAAAK